MNRRETLKALGLIAAGTGLVTSSCRTEDKIKSADTTKATDKLPGVQDFEHERNEKLQSETYFTEHELATITVLADIIIPKDDISGSASDAGVPAFIEFMVKDIPDNQLPMRGGLKWLDLQSQKRYSNVFVKLSEKEQTELLDLIAYPDKATPDMQQGVAFFSLMRDLTASGFFTSQIGVKDIGYVGNIPGVWNGVPEDVLQKYGFDSTI